jgi:hypothetical protein
VGGERECDYGTVVPQKGSCFYCSLTSEEKLVYAARERIFAHLPWIVVMASSSESTTGVL